MLFAFNSQNLKLQTNKNPTTVLVLLLFNSFVISMKNACYTHILD